MRHEIIYMGILGLSSLLPACSGCGSAKSTAEEIAAARNAGYSRAIELSDGAATDTLFIENTLLDVRERETRLRSNGHGDAADAYIGSFIATLDSVNPSLASILR